MADVTLRPGAPRVGRDHFKTVLAHDERVHTGRACRLGRYPAIGHRTRRSARPARPARCTAPGSASRSSPGASHRGSTGIRSSGSALRTATTRSSASYARYRAGRTRGSRCSRAIPASRPLHVKSRSRNLRCRNEFILVIAHELYNSVAPSARVCTRARCPQPGPPGQCSFRSPSACSSRSVSARSTWQTSSRDTRSALPPQPRAAVPHCARRDTRVSDRAHCPRRGPAPIPRARAADHQPHRECPRIRLPAR